MADPIYEKMLSYIEKSVNEVFKTEEDVAKFVEKNAKITGKFDERVSVRYGGKVYQSEDSHGLVVQICKDKNIACESKVVEQEEPEEDLAGKFGVFGYSIDDEATHVTHYEGEEEAKAAALELAHDINHKDLDYVEVWQANEKGEFGDIEGSNLIWKSDAPENESKVNEEEIDETNVRNYSDAQLRDLMSKLKVVAKVFPEVSSRMDQVQDEITKRDQEEQEKEKEE